MIQITSRQDVLDFEKQALPQMHNSVYDVLLVANVSATTVGCVEQADLVLAIEGALGGYTMK